MPSETGSKFVIGAVGDLHVKEHSGERFRELFAEINEKADAIVLCGDLTDSGTEDEASELAMALEGAAVPVLGVFGNHDHDADRIPQIKKILRDASMILLEENTYEIGEIGFAGVKGFGGGFGRYMFTPFGEQVMKQFAEESVREALKLESDLRKLKTKYKVVVLHYAPIVATIHGEPPEIYPFLGSSRIGEVIERYGVEAVFHGHAHHGTFEGMLRGGARVYNCAQEVVKRHSESGKSYVLIEVDKAVLD